MMDLSNFTDIQTKIFSRTWGNGVELGELIRKSTNTLQEEGYTILNVSTTTDAPSRSTDGRMTTVITFARKTSNPLQGLINEKH